MRRLRQASTGSLVSGSVGVRSVTEILQRSEAQVRLHILVREHDADIVPEVLTDAALRQRAPETPELVKVVALVAIGRETRSRKRLDACIPSRFGN